MLLLGASLILLIINVLVPVIHRSGSLLLLSLESLPYLKFFNPACSLLLLVGLPVAHVLLFQALRDAQELEAFATSSISECRHIVAPMCLRHSL